MVNSCIIGLGFNDGQLLNENKYTRKNLEARNIILAYREATPSIKIFDSIDAAYNHLNSNSYNEVLIVGDCISAADLGEMIILVMKYLNCKILIQSGFILFGGKSVTFTRLLGFADSIVKNRDISFEIKSNSNTVIFEKAPKYS